MNYKRKNIKCVIVIPHQKIKKVDIALYYPTSKN